MTVTAFPLAWPSGWKRTPASERQYGRFNTKKVSGQRTWPSATNVTIAEAVARLREQLEMMGVHDDDLVLSTNLKLRLDGLPRSDQRAPDDPGACVYWTDPLHGGAPKCMAIDRYTDVAQNIAALAATIEALRSIERHGGAVVLDRAFTGFTALPPPIVAGMKKHWRDVLGLRGANVTADVLQRTYRELAAAHHPDRGGDPGRMAEINQARDEALKELGA